jgi:dual specificity MAP kinase phosphatase
MLHALGITHVVSVGECALVPPVCPMPRSGSNGVVEPGTQVSLNADGNGNGNSNSSFVYGSGPNGQGSLWIEEREGRIKVLDIKGVSDDGIDSLRPQFAPICDWIEKARQENGKVYVFFFSIFPNRSSGAFVSSGQTDSLFWLDHVAWFIAAWASAAVQL